MKKRTAYFVFGLILTLASAAFADEITFSFVVGNPGSLDASLTGLTAGSALNIVVSDAQTGQIFPLLGTFNASTGKANSFTILPTLVIASYSAGGTGSVSIVDFSNNPLVTGNMSDDAAFLSGYPNGAGAFLGKFDVTFVSPSVLALFGLGPKFLDTGSVSATFAGDNFNGTDVTGTLGGGSVTINAPVPEPSALGLLLTGVSLITCSRFKLSKGVKLCRTYKGF